MCLRIYTYLVVKIERSFVHSTSDVPLPFLAGVQLPSSLFNDETQTGRYEGMMSSHAATGDGGMVSGPGP